MTQEWFIENGYSIVPNYTSSKMLLYFDNKEIYQTNLTNPSFGKDMNHFIELYPICLAHKRNLLIKNIMNDSDIGYEE